MRPPAAGRDRSPLGPVLADFARALVADSCGSGIEVAGIEPLAVRGPLATLLITLARPARRLVLKVLAQPSESPVDLARTAAAMSLARLGGTPVPETLGLDCSLRAGPWQGLLLDHVEGVEWAQVRPRLDEGQVDAALRQIASAVLMMQSVDLPAYGELDDLGRPRPVDLLTALRQRAGLIADRSRRDLFLGLLDRDAALFSTSALTGSAPAATLCHDDLHGANLLWRPDPAGWQLAAVIDWDKAWAGPAESDVARMAFWDLMTGPGFWDVYRAAVPEADGDQQRAQVYQLLWCLEYDVPTPRHRADTARLCRQLGLPPPSLT